MEKWSYFDKTEYKNGFTIMTVGYEVELDKDTFTFLELMKTIENEKKE